VDHKSLMISTIKLRPTRFFAPVGPTGLAVNGQANWTYRKASPV
jgi:hypothetical protein